MCALAGLQKCEVAQRPRAANRAEHRSTPHLCQLNIRKQMWSSTFVSDGTFQRISIKHSGFKPDSVIEASFKVLTAVPHIMNKVQLFQDRILTDARTASSGHWRGGLSLGRPDESPGKSLPAP